MWPRRWRGLTPCSRTAKGRGVTAEGILSFLYDVSLWAIPVVVAITFHEAAHGWVADRLGDDTARRLGRVTFNPLRHIDRFGTIVLPALLLISPVPFVFGYAKPVPVNFARLRRPKRDMVWVALAGPGTNMVLALCSVWLLRFVHFLPQPVADWSALTLDASVLINVILAVFNMLPLPPLDGGRVAVGLLPKALAVPLARVERWGILIVIGAMFVLPVIGDLLGLNLRVFVVLVWAPSVVVMGGIASLAGVDEDLLFGLIAFLMGHG